jgi:hypothetical protein
MSDVVHATSSWPDKKDCGTSMGHPAGRHRKEYPIAKDSWRGPSTAQKFCRVMEDKEEYLTTIECAKNTPVVARHPPNHPTTHPHTHLPN